MKTVLRWVLSIPALLLALLLTSKSVSAQEHHVGKGEAQRLQKKEPVSRIRLRLVSARDHIEGSFVGNEAVYADRDRVYLASNQGKLFVLARDRRRNFPLLQVIDVADTSLSAVRGDATHLYITSADGNLRIFEKKFPLSLIATVHVSDYPLLSLAVTTEDLYVSEKFAHMAVDDSHVFFSQLNRGENGLVVKKKSREVASLYGQSYEWNTTVVFNRRSGKRVFGIANPIDMYGRTSLVNIYADRRIVALTVPGCCGTGINLYDPETFALRRTVPLVFANTVVRSNHYLIAGTEDGRVTVHDLRHNPSPLVSTADLREITRHTGSEDIEIRALWKDDFDSLIFAASSWGNEKSRRPSLPSLFILEVVEAHM